MKYFLLILTILFFHVFSEAEEATSKFAPTSQQWGALSKVMMKSKDLGEMVDTLLQHRPEDLKYIKSKLGADQSKKIEKVSVIKNGLEFWLNDTLYSVRQSVENQNLFYVNNKEIQYDPEKPIELLIRNIKVIMPKTQSSSIFDLFLPKAQAQGWEVVAGAAVLTVGVVVSNAHDIVTMNILDRNRNLIGDALRQCRAATVYHDNKMAVETEPKKVKELSKKLDDMLLASSGIEDSFCNNKAMVKNITSVRRWMQAVAVLDNNEELVGTGDCGAAQFLNKCVKEYRKKTSQDNAIAEKFLTEMRSDLGGIESTWLVPRPKNLGTEVFEPAEIRSAK